MHINSRKFNLFILKNGSIFHTIFLVSMLMYAEITPKTPMFWAFLLNHVMFSYFLFIRGCAFGISKTIDIFTYDNIKKSIQEDINKFNLIMNPPSF